MANVNTVLLLILIGVTVAVLLQAGVLYALYRTVSKAVQSANQQAEDYRAKLTPIIDAGGQLINTANELVASAQKLIKTVQPHVESTVTELANMARDVHAEANRLQQSVDEVAAKARRHADRVDGMVGSFLDGLDRFGTFLNESVRTPFRQVNGIVAAARAVVDTLRSPRSARPRQRPTPPSMYVGDDKDLFV
jgi:methyl-accepting chemotaxis protein